jgi:hypothetical protein
MLQMLGNSRDQVLLTPSSHTHFDKTVAGGKLAGGNAGFRDGVSPRN